MTTDARQTWLAEFTPVSGFTFRDARPFQPGENRTAGSLPFPPPPGAFWHALCKADRMRHPKDRGEAVASGTKVDTSHESATAERRSSVETGGTARGLWLGRGQRLHFPEPLDVLNSPDGSARRWTVAQTRISNGSGVLPLRPEGTVRQPGMRLLTEAGLRSYLLGDGYEPLESVSQDDVVVLSSRTGVALDGRTARDGHLFTAPIATLRQGAGRSEEWRFYMPFLMPVAPEGSRPASATQLVRLGGEARHARLRVAQSTSWPGSDQALRDAVRDRVLAVPRPKNGPCRLKLVFLTPAIFSASMRLLRTFQSRPAPPAWRPFWLHDGPQPMKWLGGASLTLHGAITGRPFAVGGWDSSGGREIPKPLHRAMPAGSVYYLSLTPAAGQTMEEAVERMFERLWFGTLLVDENGGPTHFGQAGYGVVVPGGWDEQ